MKAIVTRPNSDGTYNEVGMNNKYLTSRYKTEKGLLKYGIAKHFKGKLKIEIWYGSSIYKEPDKIIYKDN